MNLLQSAGQVLGSLAPTIATAIGGPFAGMAVAKLEQVFGLSPTQAGSTTQAQLETAIAAATPEQLIALKTADQKFQTDMAALGIQKEDLELKDVQSARAMQISTKDSTPRNLSYLLLAFTGLMMLCLFFGWAKLDGALAGTLIGYLVSETKSMMQFWFGTTRGSQDKDATIASIAKES